MSASERAKGARGELEVIRILKDNGWTDADRTSNGKHQGGRGDITGGPPGVHIECKRQERLNVPAALRQVEADANPADMPVLVHRPSGRGWMATLPLGDLLALLHVRERLFTMLRENQDAA